MRECSCRFQYVHTASRRLYVKCFCLNQFVSNVILFIRVVFFRYFVAFLRVLRFFRVGWLLLDIFGSKIKYDGILSETIIKHRATSNAPIYLSLFLSPLSSSFVLSSIFSPKQLQRQLFLYSTAEAFFRVSCEWSDDDSANWFGISSRHSI